MDYVSFRIVESFLGSSFLTAQKEDRNKYQPGKKEQERGNGQTGYIQSPEYIKVWLVLKFLCALDPNSVPLGRRG